MQLAEGGNALVLPGHYLAIENGADGQAFGRLTKVGEGAINEFLPARPQSGFGAVDQLGANAIPFPLGQENIGRAQALWLSIQGVREQEGVRRQHICTAGLAELLQPFRVRANSAHESGRYGASVFVKKFSQGMHDALPSHAHA